MNKYQIITLAVTVGIVGLFGTLIILNNKSEPSGNLSMISNPEATMDYKNGTYVIDGIDVQLIDGVAEIEVVPGSASKLVTRYFGNEHVMDLNGDGRDDVAFIVTQESGGSGVFYFAVAAIKTDAGFVGTDGYLLGDRISPQSTDSSPNSRQKNVVVFNYAGRKQDEAMTVQPSVSTSVYLKVVPETNRWAIVEPNFAGESNQTHQEGDTPNNNAQPTERYSAQVDRVKVMFDQWDYTRFRLQTNELVREGKLNTERGFEDDVDATVYVLYWDKPEGEQMRYVRLTGEPGYLYALDGYQNIIKSGRLVLE